MVEMRVVVGLGFLRLGLDLGIRIRDWGVFVTIELKGLLGWKKFF